MQIISLKSAIYCVFVILGIARLAKRMPWSKRKLLPIQFVSYKMSTVYLFGYRVEGGWYNTPVFCAQRTFNFISKSDHISPFDAYDELKKRLSFMRKEFHEPNSACLWRCQLASDDNSSITGQPFINNYKKHAIPSYKNEPLVSSSIASELMQAVKEFNEIPTDIEISE